MKKDKIERAIDTGFDKLSEYTTQFAEKLTENKKFRDNIEKIIRDTQRKVERNVENILKKLDMSQRRELRELRGRIEKLGVDFEKRLAKYREEGERTLRSTIEGLNLPSREDINELLSRLKSLTRMDRSKLVKEAEIVSKAAVTPSKPSPVRKKKAPSRPKEAKPKARKTCNVRGCQGRHSAKGYCARHYQQWRRGTLKSR